MNAPPKRTCSQCGCTDDDCRQCIEATGEPCFWVTEDMCSACADPAVVAQALERCAERNPLSNSRCVHAPYHAGDHLDGMGKGWTRDRMRVYDAPAPTTPTNTAPDPLAFTHGVLELVVEEAKRRETIVAGVAKELEQLEAPPDYVLEQLAAKLRTAMDPGVQARAEPTLDETLTSKVTPQERLLVARLLEQADAAIATMRTHIEMRARIAELEHECTRHVRDRVAQAARVEELEQDVRTFVAAESATRDIVNATARAMRRRAAMRPLPQRPWPVARQVDDWAGKLEDAVAPPLWGLYSDATEGFIREWRRTRTRAPRAASSGEGAASTPVQVTLTEEQFALWCAATLEWEDPQTGLPRQADSAGKRDGSAEHGTQAPGAAAVPAARQKARAAEKQARDASFEAECRRREANHQRGPPSARDVAHVEQKKATKKKQRKRGAVRQGSPRKRGSS
jgi:hypothetical protein